MLLAVCEMFERILPRCRRRDECVLQRGICFGVAQASRHNGVRRELIGRFAVVRRNSANSGNAAHERARMAAVEDERYVLCFCSQLEKQSVQLRAADVEYLSGRISRIIWNDGLIKTADFLSCYILHLRAVAAVMENNDIVLLSFRDEVVLDGADNGGVRCLSIFEDKDVLRRKLELSDQDGLQILNVIDRAGKRRYA